MSDGVHLLIPFAYSSSEGCAQALRTLALPQLERLLARLAPAAIDRGDEQALSMPHERALAREYNLPAADGLIPWAAWQLAQSGRNAGDEGWAWVTPCHWRVATDHVAMGHPQDLQLDAHDSQALLAAMRPYFEEDAIDLSYDAPTLWLARGSIFRELPAASLDRVVGRTIDDWMPRSAQARPVRRLQQEMQMLLYTHEINEERVRRGLLPVNSFWVSGTGALPGSVAPAGRPGLRVTPYLRDAALIEDWRGWAAAWQQLDAQECARLGQALDSGQAVTLTLCGERSARSWSGASRGRWSRLVGGMFNRQRAAAVLETL